MNLYRVYLQLDVIAGIRQMRGKQRETIENFISSLAVEPEQPGDFSETDRSGRTIQVKIIGAYAVSY